jgi:hypothetical protein
VLVFEVFADVSVLRTETAKRYQASASVIKRGTSAGATAATTASGGTCILSEVRHGQGPGFPGLGHQGYDSRFDPLDIRKNRRLGSLLRFHDRLTS